MRLNSFQIGNFRRLKDVRIDMDTDNTIFVGANNSGKTSATQIFRAFLDRSNRPKLTIHDFSSHCWNIFNSDAIKADTLPKIRLDLWFDIDKDDLYRVLPLLPTLDWDKNPVGVRLLFEPRDGSELIARFKLAKSLADEAVARTGNDDGKFKPWPHNLSDYLSRELSNEYEIGYYVLDRDEFDSGWTEKPGYVPQTLGDTQSSARSLLSSLIRIDFLDAQRFLSDSEASGKSESLSRRLGHFYKTNLAKYDDQFEAKRALADSEQRLNDHLSHVFKPTLDSLGKLGYPGFSNPELVIKSAFDSETIFSSKNTSVYYTLDQTTDGDMASTAVTLPGNYNGLGFKNLIYMVIEMLDFEEQWASDDNRAPLHLVIIEEPEAHLHAQLQQVFIKQVREVLTQESAPFHTQFLVTTHSSHIIYESGLNPIRYFRRSQMGAGSTHTDVLNLSQLKSIDSDTRQFLLRYIKLTHCDLFFADAVIMVEGNVERLLLPLMIERVAEDLKTHYLTIMEVGGAFAHTFKDLIEFIGIPTLVITDLDSVAAKPIDKDKKPETEDFSEEAAVEAADVQTAEEAADAPRVKAVVLSASMTTAKEAETSNETLKQWLPGLTMIDELLDLDRDKKVSPASSKIRVAYQIATDVEWKGTSTSIAGRTFEEAFAYENLAWTQDGAQRGLHLKVVPNKDPNQPLDKVLLNVHKRVRVSSFSKTEFALTLMAAPWESWKVPSYIVEGLEWLVSVLSPVKELPKEAGAGTLEDETK